MMNQAAGPSNIEPLWYQAYHIPSLSDTKLLRYQIFQIPNVSNTEPISHRVLSFPEEILSWPPVHHPGMPCGKIDEETGQTTLYWPLSSSGWPPSPSRGPLSPFSYSHLTSRGSWLFVILNVRHWEGPSTDRLFFTDSWTVARDFRLIVFFLSNESAWAPDSYPKYFRIWFQIKRNNQTRKHH